MNGLRIIRPLDAVLLRAAVLEEADPLTAELAADPAFLAQFLVHPQHAGALVGHGRVLAAGGLIPRWHGMAEAWLMISPRAEMPVRVHTLRTVRKLMDEYQRLPAFRRIEMSSRVGDAWDGVKFARLMRMQCEGLMRCRDPLGRDYRVFARIAA
jgi:hypothetical protein